MVIGIVDTPVLLVPVEVLLRFDQNLSSVIRKYETFVSEGVAAGRRPELTGGGLVRSAWGWQSLASTRRFGDYRKGDERILGDSDFVDEVLKHGRPLPPESPVPVFAAYPAQTRCSGCCAGYGPLSIGSSDDRYRNRDRSRRPL
jgi:hypothetical protein